MENASLGKILQEIKKQSGKNILYNNTLVDEYKDESVNIENMTLEEALKMCLKNKKLQYKIIDGVIIIEPKNQKINHPAIPKGVSQNIRGQVIDQNSDMPLIGATVVLLNSNPVIGTVTDNNGCFSIENIPVGRQGLKISYVGYEPVIVRNLYVNSGKEQVSTIKMEEKVFEGEAILIKAFNRKDKSINDMAQVSSRSFTIEETEKYAGGLGDPARMASSFAGVLTSGSQTNEIVIRGNSPNGLLWRMNGLDIPNPNHYGAISSSGGAISMLNNNVLRNSDFLTGAFPAEYGNALSGVFDLFMRKGNNQKREYTAQAGFFGTELGVEGPFKKGKRASYLANYRYSTLAIFDLLNLSFGYSGIPKYQDMNYNINIPTKKAGTFALFGILGKNELVRETENDTLTDNFELGGKMLFLGFSHTYIFNEKTSIRSSVGYSINKENSKNIIIKNNEKISQSGNLNSVNNLQFNIDLKRKINSKNMLKAGANFQQINTSFLDSSWLDDYDVFINRLDIQGNLYLFQSYIQWKHKLSGDISYVLGINQTYANRGRENIIEPRLSLSWEITSKQSINVGFGKHSRLQPLFVYFNKILIDTTNKIYDEPNLNLKMTRANHYIASYNSLFNKNLRLKVEGYFQQLNQVPVEKVNSYLSMLNYGSTFSIYEYWALVNNGTGYNVGTEITFEKFLSDNYYYLFTVSLYDSKYKGSDKVLRNTRFNGNAIINIVGGYEWPLKNQNTLALDIKSTWAEGQRKVAIDKEASRLAKKTVYNTSNAFEERYKDYFRFDFRISYKINKEKASHILALDIINATFRNNHLIEIYNPVTDEVGEASITTIMPSFLWRMNF